MSTAQENQPAAKRRPTIELTIAQVAEVFGVSQVTVFTWKRGTSRRPALPMTPKSAQSNSPRFFASDLRRYAEKHGLTFAREPEDVVASWVYVKPGPKPKPTVADHQNVEERAESGASSSTGGNKTSRAGRHKPRH